ncbi:hypothetical protein C7401_111110 [Paraburkholderia unamae]|nr:hypothetical protein C7401_111110 [Paraburkholderia unamae]
MTGDAWCQSWENSLKSASACCVAGLRHFVAPGEYPRRFFNIRREKPAPRIAAFTRGGESGALFSSHNDRQRNIDP